MNTTIAVSTDIRDKIREFGDKGESYTEILERLYNSARERQLHDLLFDERGTAEVRHALARAKKRWQK